MWKPDQNPLFPVGVSAPLEGAPIPLFLDTPPGVRDSMNQVSLQVWAWCARRREAVSRYSGPGRGRAIDYKRSWRPFHGK
jgi:hypothetical protein